MAAADLGVALGFRNRRRLANGAVGLVVIAAAAGAILLLARPSNHGGPSLSARLPGHAGTFVTAKLVYGMSKPQVLRLVGQPTTTVGACWEYRENLTIRNGQNMLNAERVCFLSGVYSYSYSEIDGKWDYPAGGPRTVPHA